MDAIIISKFLLLLTLLASVRTKDNNGQVLHKNDTKSPSRTNSSVVHSQLLKNSPIIYLLNDQHLPRPLKLQLNSNYDYDDNENTTQAKDQPRRLKHKSDGAYNSRLSAALNIAAKQGLDAMIKLYEKTEPELLRRGQFLDPKHPGAQLSKFSEPLDGTENNAKAAFATLIATKYFQKSYKQEADDLGRQAPPPKVSFRRTPLEGLCPPRDPPRCLPAAQRYRTHDGTCNNPKRLRWGSALLPFNRFLPPEYGDGIDTIRGSVEDEPLSSARFVSLLVHGARESEAPVTLMIAQWGQLVDHDLTSTAQPRSVNGSVPRCCGSDDFHPSCLPIKVPLDDPWLAPLKVRCLEFLRSAPAQRRDCVLSWREQTNQATSYLDASPVYSSSARNSDSARIFRSGLLQFGRGDPQEDVCLRGAIGDHCIRAGDGRSGEQPGLLAMHHVWVGEHNRIALELSDLNLHWSDEKVYQEARRIVGALFQHITYREFLPLVVGREVCKLFDLELLNAGYSEGYDPNINPTVANSFAAAAFRFGHSLIQSTYMRCDKNHNFLDNNVPLHNENTNGDMGGPGSLHRLLRGMAAQKAQKRDEFITAELTNHLFQSGSFPFGLDLAAINIQRGRDHGIPAYTAWREPCGLSPINNWEDFEKIVGPASAKRISHAYRSVHDIDLFVGGISERPVIGGLVGPTFACIIAQQFSNLRKGDRFWYENAGFESSFTPAQLHSIRKVSLAQVVCRTLGSGTLQPHIFIPHDIPGNERVTCGTDVLAPIDLFPWLEQDPFQETRSPSTIPPPVKLPQSSTEPLFDRIDFVPNGSTGLNRQSDKLRNMTQISDKLDMKLPTRFTATPPTKRVHNKIDSSKKRKTSNTKTGPTGSPNNKPQDFTTRRTVIINNIPLILRRSVDPPSAERLGPETRSGDFDLDYESDAQASKEGHDSIYVQIDRSNTNKTATANGTRKDKPEHRHNKEETIYGSNKSQKLIIPAPETEEYEIEINIRQTNNRRPTYDRYHDYTSKYDDHNTISTPFSYTPSTSRPRPNYELSSDYRPYTKPPKIIYLNDQDDYTTTQAPGLLQTFFMVGSNSLNSISDHFQQKPNSFFSSNLFGGGSNGNGASTSANSVSQAQIGPSGTGSSSSSSSSHTNNIFNFNIRPSRPSFDTSLSESTSSGTYGLQNFPRRPSPLNSDNFSRPSNPFSTNYPPYQSSPSTLPAYHTSNHDYDYYRHSTTTRRPPYYNRPTNSYNLRNKDLLPAESKTISRTKTKYHDVTTTIQPDNDSKTDDDYYDDSDDMVTNFDKDGYLRPEHMIFDILNHKDKKNSTTQTTYENGTTVVSRDDFVLPALTETESETKPTEQNETSYYDAIPRRPAFEILAEDYDDISPPKFRRKIHTNPAPLLVPFAPITILTKPERPDHWVIFDEPKEQDLPPLPPDLNTGNIATMEFPKPIAIQIRNNRHDHP